MMAKPAQSSSDIERPCVGPAQQFSSALSQFGKLALDQEIPFSGDSKPGLWGKGVPAPPLLGYVTIVYLLCVRGYGHIKLSGTVLNHAGRVLREFEG